VDPRTEKVEVFCKGLWNTWGHQFDKWGQSFQTDGAGSSGITWSFPGATFNPFEGNRRVTQSISPGSYPKFAGLELRLLAPLPRGLARQRDHLRFSARTASCALASPTSPSEKSRRPDTPRRKCLNLVRTSDVAFRPIDVKLGPDGALYVARAPRPRWKRHASTRGQIRGGGAI